MTIPTYGRALLAKMRRRTLYLLLVVALLALELVSPLCGLYSPWTRLVEGYAAWFLLSVIAYRPELRLFAWLDARLLRALGRISGSFYVLHMILATAFFALLTPRHLPAVPYLGVWALLLFLFVLTVCSWLSYTLIEAQGIAIGKRLLLRRTAPALQVATVP
jgi:peptidoglycan/LPS O-acetylase OafA/YrhL